MKISTKQDTKYSISYTTKFSKQLKKLQKQGKNIKKLEKVITKLANNKKLDVKYKDHCLINDKFYKNCRECHIEPDWLLVYRYENNELILLLFATGSHSDLFK